MKPLISRHILESTTMTSVFAPTSLTFSFSCKWAKLQSPVPTDTNCFSIVEQPFKIPFVAAVAFYGNDVKPEITLEAMRRVGERAQEALDAGEWKDFKLLLRFFACLQSLYQDDGIFSFLGQDRKSTRLNSSHMS